MQREQIHKVTEAQVQKALEVHAELVAERDGHNFAFTKVREALRTQLMERLGNSGWTERFQKGGWRLLVPTDSLLAGMALLGLVQVGLEIYSARFFQQQAEGVPPILLAMGIGVFATFVISMLVAMRERRRLARVIPASNIAQIVASGPAEINEVLRAIPYPWKWFYLRPARDLREALKLLLGNVEWFLKPRERYVSPTWVLYVAGSLLMVLNMVLMTASFKYATPWVQAHASPWGGRFLESWFLIGNAVSALSLQLIFAAQTRDLNYRKLAAEHLRSVFLGDTDKPVI